MDGWIEGQGARDTRGGLMHGIKPANLCHWLAWCIFRIEPRCLWALEVEASSCLSKMVELYDSGLPVVIAFVMTISTKNLEDSSIYHIDA